MTYKGSKGVFRLLERVNRTHCKPDSGMNSKVNYKENITAVIKNLKGKKKTIEVN